MFNSSTGYIGGTILQRLLDHPKKDDFQITALIRSEEKANIIEKLGVRPVIGSNADHDLLTEQAEKSDVVISAVSSSNFETPEIKMAS